MGKQKACFSQEGGQRGSRCPGSVTSGIQDTRSLAVVGRGVLSGHQERENTWETKGAAGQLRPLWEAQVSVRGLRSAPGRGDATGSGGVQQGPRRPAWRWGTRRRVGPAVRRTAWVGVREALAPGCGQAARGQGLCPPEGRSSLPHPSLLPRRGLRCPCMPHLGTNVSSPPG